MKRILKRNIYLLLEFAALYIGTGSPQRLAATARRNGSPQRLAATARRNGSPQRLALKAV